MMKKILAMALSMAMVFTMLPATSVNAENVVTPASMERIVSAGDAPVENLARQATASAAVENDWAKALNMNNGELAGSGGNWGCWGAAAEKFPMEVKLTWAEAQTMSSMRVMWWADNNSVDDANGVKWPSSAKVQYLDGTEWRNISDVGVEHGGVNEGISGANKVWNVVNFANPITTTELRMMLYPTNGAGMGISEWEVFADKLKEDITEAKITGATELAVGQTVEYIGSVAPQSLQNNASYEWSVASGSESLIAIQGNANGKNVLVKALAAGEAKLHLKATESGIVKETDYVINTMNEQDILEFDVNLLQTPEKVNADFTLPTKSKNGYIITWKSDNEAIVMNNGVGMVTKGDERLKVKLTATITGKDEQESGKRTATKDFIVVVPPNVYLASEAAVTGSYEGGWGEVLSHINDGSDLTGWNGHNHIIEGAVAQEEWIQYTFEQKLELTGSTIRYKDDGGGVVVPSKVEFQYYDGNAESWKTLPAEETWTYVAEKDNEYNFSEKIITNQIKIVITSGQTTAGVTAASYIYEWGLLGKKYMMPDLTHLNGLIAQAEELDTTGKTDEQVTALAEFLAAAQAVVTDKNPTQAQVDKAYTDLRDIIVALGGTIQIDKTALDTAIIAADALAAEKDKYTPASWKKVEDALTAAKELQESETADQIAVDEAAAALNNAVSTLVEKADKTALEAAIAKAERLKANQAQYPGANWEALDTALTAATATKNNENANQAAVDTALDNLNGEIAKVESYKEEDSTKPGIDKADLSAAIVKAQELKDNKEDYLEDADWAALDIALTAAITVRDNEDADQEAVNTALTDLNTSIDNIEAKKKPGTDPTEPDKTALKEAINKAESLKAEKDTYTEISWQKVETALAAAIEVWDNENAEKELIDEAAKNLEDAIAALEKKSSDENVQPVSFAALTKAIDNVKNYKQADYTEASWKNFDTALKAAQAVAANKSATQVQVDKAAADLNNAAKALVKLKIVSTRKVTLGVGESYSVKGKNCTYTISDGRKITINAKGTVKAKKTGSVVVKAINVNGNVTQYNIIIKKAPQKISKVTFNKKAIKKNKVTLKKGKKGTLRVTLPKGTASKITYTSSNKKIATVDSKGVIKAKKKKGTTTITIKTFNKKSKKIKVTVK